MRSCRACYHLINDHDIAGCEICACALGFPTLHREQQEENNMTSPAEGQQGNGDPIRVYHQHVQSERCFPACEAYPYDENSPLYMHGYRLMQTEEQRDGNVGELIDGRVNVYGDPAKVFIRQAQAWSGILGIEVQPWQVALCMLSYKLVRTAVTPDYSDNSDDIEGYLDIFRTIIGEDMVQARDTAAYLAGGGKGARS